MKRAHFVGVSSALILALLPLGALASTPYSESLFGVETGVPQSTATCTAPMSVSPFAGYAHGTITGGFRASICHGPLTSAGSAAILGGVATVSSGRTVVTATFLPGGTITQSGPTAATGAWCVQRYVVVGSLAGKSRGTFTARLTHYGYWDGLACHVFFATVSGRATLTV
jgi:hypothetical protein